MPENELAAHCASCTNISAGTRPTLSQGVFNIHAKDPSHPWENWIVCELIVVAFLMLIAALVRASLSPDKPGKLQMAFEWIYGFITEKCPSGGHSSPPPVSSSYFRDHFFCSFCV